MRNHVLLCAVVLLSACAEAETDADAAADTTAAVTPAPAGITTADVQGAWDVESMMPGSDSVIAHSMMWAGAEDGSWKTKFDHQPDTIPVRVVAIEGDSIVTEFGPYSSALRPGVQVVTTSVWRKAADGGLVGRSTARYNVQTADSVVVIDMRAKRAQ